MIVSSSWKELCDGEGYQASWGALDVHKEQVTACVRTAAGGGGHRREQHVAEFKTTVQGLLGLRDWLSAHGVTHVVMEASGVYWKPPWAILQDEFECMLVNARHAKQVPGRKTDVKDAEWLCQLLQAGLLNASFVPPKPIRTLRNLTRYRKDPDPGAPARRQQAAQDPRGHRDQARLRVASDILGKSGRAMLDALCQGTRDPEVLTELARGKLRAKIPALREALEGRFDEEHALVVGAILTHIDFLDEQITLLSDAIGEKIAPFEKAVELLCTILGVQRRTAEVIIAETGADMSRCFPTAGLLASWAGLCPGNDQSAGKRRSGHTRKGSKWLGISLTEAAHVNIRSRDTTYLSAQYRRLKTRRGHRRAIGAVKHSIITAVWHMLCTGETYKDLGGDYSTRLDPNKHAQRPVAQLERLGHTVTLEKAAT
jgi:transposase